MTPRPSRILTRTGDQGNGHKAYFVGVPWQIAEAIPAEVEFSASVDELTGVISLTPVSDMDQLVPFGSVMAALAACGVDAEQANRIARVLRALPRPEHVTPEEEPKP